jgi:leader peptidase (prepilin peptidase)/N-methyltransferase
MSGVGWWYDALFFGVLGAITASFLCVCGERGAKGISIGGRSLCVCKRQLKWSENLPVIGWLKAGGRASCCNAEIPKFYVLTEVFLLLGWALAGGLYTHNKAVSFLIIAISSLMVYTIARRKSS